MFQMMIISVSIVKAIKVMLLSSVKFVFSPPLAIYYGFESFEVLLLTITGGCLGFLFFYYLSHFILLFYNNYIIKIPILNTYYKKIKQKKDKKKFTRKNKMIITTKQRFGLIGIIITTPILLSIPLGAFLAKKYFERTKYLLVYLMISIVVWAILITMIVTTFEYVLNMFLFRINN